MKEPEAIYNEAPTEIRLLAEEVLRVEKEYILDRRPHGIIDELVSLFKGRGNQ